MGRMASVLRPNGYLVEALEKNACLRIAKPSNQSRNILTCELGIRKIERCFVF